MFALALRWPLLSQSGGLCSVSGSLSIGSGGTGTYNLDGGTLVVGNLIADPGFSFFNFDGGTLKAAASFATSQGLALATGAGSATIDTAGFTLTLASPLTGSGNLVKTDMGALVLSAFAPRSAGNLFLSGGTLTLSTPARAMRQLPSSPAAAAS